MTRKSRELTLVLLGAGILTAGYFYFRENHELFAKEEEQAKQQASSQRHGYHGGALVFIHSSGYSGGRSASPAMASGATRGGFGSIGAHSAGG